MKFIILHGSFGSPEDNWFPQLKESLEGLGEDVLVPKFPIENWGDMIDNPEKLLENQNLDNWLSVFSQELKYINSGEKICVIAHSLGPVFLLHIIEKLNIKIDTAIFVSPFLDLKSSKELWPIDKVNKTFYKTDFDFNNIKKSIGHSYVLYSDNDPYVKEQKSKEFAQKLGSSLIFVKHGGHMNSEVNLNEFPLVFELCKTCMDYILASQQIVVNHILLQ